MTSSSKTCAALGIALAAAFLTHCGEPAQRTCENLSDEAAIRRLAIYEAPENLSCFADAECRPAYHRLSCFTDCAEPVALSTSKREGVEMKVAAIEAEVCGQHAAQNCPPAIERPCGGGSNAALGFAACRDGLCLIQYSPRD
jgi:hypothetical protein